MPVSIDLIQRLNECPVGRTGWRQYEDICIEIWYV